MKHYLMYTARQIAGEPTRWGYRRRLVTVFSEWASALVFGSLIAAALFTVYLFLVFTA